MTTPEREVLRKEVAALDAEQMHLLLILLAGSDPGAVRHALDTERATRPRENGDCSCCAGAEQGAHRDLCDLCLTAALAGRYPHGCGREPADV